MANIKISDLPAASSVAAGDLFEVSQGSGTLTSRKATGTQVQSFVLGSYAGASTITTLGTIGTGAWQATTISVTYGGTGASTAAGARTNLGAAASGANSDITSLSGLTTALSVAQGGTGATTAANARTNLGLGTAATMIGPSGAIVGTTDTQTLTSKVLKGQSFQYFNSGATSALDYTNGSNQRWAPTGSVALSVSNWPASGVLGELLIEGINLGAATITWPTINWIKSDGTTTTTFASNGVTLQSSGTDWVFLWTRDGGTTVYGKIVR